MTDVFTIEMFAGHENSKFLLHYGESSTAELELISVKDIGSSSRQEQFSLIFKGPLTGPAVQNIYRIEHEKLGTLDLFLVPIGKESDGFKYQAIFNRLLE